MLEDSKVGCYVGNLCLAALAYVDNIILLAPTVRAMRVLLYICDDLAANVLNLYRDDGADIDIDKTRNAMCGQINNVLCYFGHLFPVLKLKMIKTYCLSLYGSVLWELDHSNLEALCCTWRKGLRRIWDLPYRTHCDILPLLICCLPMYDEICNRTANY